ncbi:hypothetical protein VitviT2T_011708 [Vitis vinifera]|uniref:Uncharacterized protein n=2 Tax=Vitis vinifera TaxID=29760 RepID=A0ABY9CE28_VITVI|nr:hypothetical protein CK203_098946 [Vitis vinifera]WJZ92726.1 hypothetical protein VitviT2T_011708 [Vitis vinifera]
MESLKCSSGSTRLSHGAPASPMHLAFHVRVSPSTLPSSSPPLEPTLPSPPATGTWWQQHCRRRTWRTPPQTARFDRGSPSRTYKGRSCWLRPQTQTPGRSYRLHSRTPTLECDGEHGTGGDNRGDDVESRQPGQISRPSGVASLTSISSVAVFGGEEEEHVMKGPVRDED